MLSISKRLAKKSQYHTTAYTAMSPLFIHAEWIRVDSGALIGPESHYLVLSTDVVLFKDIPHGALLTAQEKHVGLHWFCFAVLVGLVERSELVTLYCLLLHVSIQCNHCKNQPVLPYDKIQKDIHIARNTTIRFINCHFTRLLHSRLLGAA